LKAKPDAYRTSAGDPIRCGADGKTTGGHVGSRGDVLCGAVAVTVLVQMGPAVQLTVLPARPENAPAIKPVASKRWAQLEKSRLDALHMIFGATIPVAKEPEKI